MKHLYLYRVHLRRYGQSTRNYLLPARTRTDAITQARHANPGCEVTRCDCEEPFELSVFFYRSALS